jgi:hypothetical protein
MPDWGIRHFSRFVQVIAAMQVDCFGPSPAKILASIV